MEEQGGDSCSSLALNSPDWFGDLKGVHLYDDVPGGSDFPVLARGEGSAPSQEAAPVLGPSSWAESCWGCPGGAGSDFPPPVYGGCHAPSLDAELLEEPSGSTEGRRGCPGDEERWSKRGRWGADSQGGKCPADVQPTQIDAWDEGGKIPLRVDLMVETKQPFWLRMRTRAGRQLIEKKKKCSGRLRAKSGSEAGRGREER